jgi:5-methyltetrahydrofolate--homocysteine methyltransferase
LISKIVSASLKWEKNMSDCFEKLIDAVLIGNETLVKQHIGVCLSNKVSARVIMEKGLIAAMTIIGEKMADEEMFIPEVLLAAKAMESGIRMLKSHFKMKTEINYGTIVIGTVEGDIHDIGKNIVKLLLQGAGFNVVDLGTDVTADKFVKAVKQYGADILGMSSLLTTTMTRMNETIRALDKRGIRKSLKIIVGGAPVTQAFASKIGADRCSPDAGTAIRICQDFIKPGSPNLS